MVKEEESDKDRRTTKASTVSSVKQPAAKDGAGAYAWGTTTEVVDYDPVGYGGVSKIMTVAAPQVVQASPIPAQTMVSISDMQQFPSMGATRVVQQPQWVSATGSLPASVLAAPTVVQQAAPTTIMQQTMPATTTVTQTSVQAPAAVPVASTASIRLSPAPVVAQVPGGNAWFTVKDGRNVMEAPKVLGEDTNRAGVSLGQQQPRNQFARKPRSSDGGKTEEALAPAIDWSGSGNVAFNTSVLQVSGNPAHLTPYTVAQPQPSLQTLLAQPAQAAQFAPKPYMQPKMPVMNKRAPAVMMSGRKR